MKLAINENHQSEPTINIFDIEKWTETNADFLTAFEEFVKETGSLGLAANQLLVDDKPCEYRVCAFNVDGEYEVWFNPKLMEAKGQPSPQAETCLTHGFEQLVVADRVNGIKVDYKTESGSKKSAIEENNLKCQVIQHTLDHLDGMHEHLMALPEADSITEDVVDAKDVFVAAPSPVKANRKEKRNKRKRERKSKK
jgi:peptide deformylase